MARIKKKGQKDLTAKLQAYQAEVTRAKQVLEALFGEVSKDVLKRVLELAESPVKQLPSQSEIGEKKALLKLGIRLATRIDKAERALNRINFPDNRETLQQSISEAGSSDLQALSSESVARIIERISQTLSAVKKNDGRYSRIIAEVFSHHYKSGMRDVPFEREEILSVGERLGVKKLPKNLGDIIYSFRYRGSMPDSIQKTAKIGNVWIIRGSGRARYRFSQMPESEAFIYPTEGMLTIKVPDATPGVIAKYALSDEQALLAKLRYNRLIDVFTGVTCYSLQNHLRTNVTDVGQIETDEVYIGIDKKGTHYVFPVQAKGGKDTLSIVQIEQDFLFCQGKFPTLICQPIAAQFKESDLIVLIGFGSQEGSLKRSAEKQYRLVPPDEITPEDLQTYAISID